MQVLKSAGRFVIKLLQRETKALDEVIDLAETISVQGHKAADAAKEVIAAVKKLKEALASDQKTEEKTDKPAAA